MEKEEIKQHDRAESVDELKSFHTKEAIRRRLAGGPRHSYLKDFVYGAIDGSVTTFAVVSGVAGAGLPDKIIIILGVANLLGDGFSMAASNFLGTRAEEQLREKARKTEHQHIEKVPEGEMEEVRQIFAAKGFKGQDLEKAVRTITADKERWVETMLKEEHDLPLQGAVPVRAAAATFAAFVIIGALPLLPFIHKMMLPADRFNPFAVSTVITGVGFFIIGALKGQFVGESKYLSGIETFLVGGVAAFLAYLAGILLKGIVPS